MPFGHLPRKFLTGWVRAPRGRGVGRLHYGTHAQSCLRRCLAPEDFTHWYEIAQDRNRWRGIVKDMDL